MRYEFIKAEDEEYGFDGWKPAWEPDFEPMGGRGVAHDLLEHLAVDSSVDGEFRAMGAMLWGRAQGGAFLGQYLPHAHQHMASDVRSMLAKHYDGLNNWIETKTLRTRRLECDWAEWEVSSLVDAGIKECLQDDIWGCDDEEASRDFAKEEQVRLFGPVQRRVIEGLVRQGYRMAAKAYRNTTPSTVASEFKKIAKRADELLAYAHDGDKMVVQIDRSNMTWRMNAQEPEDDEDD